MRLSHDEALLLLTWFDKLPQSFLTVDDGKLAGKLQAFVASRPVGSDPNAV